VLAYVKASSTGDLDSSGKSVALSAKVRPLAVDAAAHDGAATGIDGNRADDSAGFAGAVWLDRQADRARSLAPQSPAESSARAITRLVPESNRFSSDFDAVRAGGVSVDPNGPAREILGVRGTPGHR
jgi:hypothetical protein